MLVMQERIPFLPVLGRSTFRQLFLKSFSSVLTTSSMDAVLRRGAGARTGNELGSRRSNIATGTTIENASCGLRQVAIMVALLSFVFTACAALVYFSKYQAVMEKLGKCEQDLFEQIIQLDRLSRQAKRAESQLKQTNEKFKVYESETEDARLMLSTVKEQLIIGKHQREQLEQQLSESRRLADEALSNLSSLKVELARAEDDIKYLKLKLSDQAIRCNAGAADREETNTSSLYPPGFHWVTPFQVFFVRCLNYLMMVSVSSAN